MAIVTPQIYNKPLFYRKKCFYTLTFLHFIVGDAQSSHNYWTSSLKKLHICNFRYFSQDTLYSQCLISALQFCSFKQKNTDKA